MTTPYQIFEENEVVPLLFQYPAALPFRLWMPGRIFKLPYKSHIAATLERIFTCEDKLKSGKCRRVGVDNYTVIARPLVEIWVTSKNVCLLPKIFERHVC